jgi:hypothetical protein
MDKVNPNETPEQREERKFQEKAASLRGHALIAHHLNGLRLAARDQIKWTAAIDTDLKAGLAAIALAASTPNDNSAEVQKQIDQITSQLNTSTAELKGEIDQHTKEK